MKNWVTSHQVFKMTAAHRQTHPNPTVHVVHRSPQNIFLSKGDVQSDVVFQCFYGARFFPCTLSSSGSPKKETWDVKSGDRGGHRFCDMILSCSVAKTCALRTSATQCHLLRLRLNTQARHRHEQRCSRSKFHLPPIIRSRITGKNVPGVLYEILPFVEAVTVIYLRVMITQT